MKCLRCAVIAWLTYYLGKPITAGDPMPIIKLGGSLLPYPRLVADRVVLGPARPAI